jgi:hypothetical protein
LTHGGHEARGGSKQLAQLRDHPPRAKPLWVYDADDWALMRSVPSGSLVCPTCRSPFQVPFENPQGTRFLRDKRGGACPHVSRPDLGGGVMSPQHRWLQERIARICIKAGYHPIVEHYETNADVYVVEAQMAIEIQRWSTDFEIRTQARRARNADVLWLITEDATSRGARQALFEQPAARVLVHSQRSRQEPLKPWEGSSLARFARLSVYATVAHLDARTSTLRTGHEDGYRFLTEVLSKQRKWYRPGTAGLPHPGSGAWVLDTDLRVVQSAPAPVTLEIAPERSSGIDQSEQGSTLTEMPSDDEQEPNLADVQPEPISIEPPPDDAPAPGDGSRDSRSVWRRFAAWLLGPRN